MDPAPMSEFPMNCFGGKGHIDVVGIARSMGLRSVGGIDLESNMSDCPKFQLQCPQYVDAFLGAYLFGCISARLETIQRLTRTLHKTDLGNTNPFASNSPEHLAYQHAYILYAAYLTTDYKAMCGRVLGYVLVEVPSEVRMRGVQ
jgi:hypothetical protein